jgi:hypothetical protein
LGIVGVVVDVVTSVVVVVGAMTSGGVVVVVVTTGGSVGVVMTTGGSVGVVVTTGGSIVVGGGGAGQITSVPNLRHCLMSFVRQRLNLPGLVIQPHEVLIALPQEATHCGLDATMRA